MRNLLIGGVALTALAACATPETTTAPLDAGTTAAATEAEAVPAVQSIEDFALIERAAIFGNAEKTQGRISPDGQYLSWIAPVDGVNNVWVAPASDPDAAKPVTNDTYRGISSHFWSPGSDYIYYTQDKGGDENFHVYASDVATGEVRDLTPVEDGTRAVIQGVSRNEPGKLLIGINDRNPQLFDLYLVDVATGEMELAAENPGYAGWLVDNSLTPRFGFMQTPGGGASIVDLEGNELVSIPAEDFLTTNPVGFNGANDAFYAVDSRGRDTAALVSIDTTTGEATVIAENDKADISDAMLHPVTYEPLAYASEYLRAEWEALTDEAAADLAFLQGELDGDIEILSATDDLSRMVVYSESAVAPGVYYMYDRKAKTLTEMFKTRPGLADAPLQPMHPVEITSRDGLALVSYLTLPPGADADGDGRPEEPVPMVLNVHGGPWARDSYGYNSWHQWLANRGYAVLSVNYRGSTGFGKNFVNAAVGEFAGKMHDDLIDAVNWTVEEEIADPEKIAIAGGSYGGYATLIGVSFTPDTFTCGVDIVGPSSLATLIESFPEYWKPILEGSWFKYVGDPSVPEEREDMLNRSAISRIDDISVPLLVGQGENDPRVTKLESDQLVASMKEKGLPVTYVNFPDEGHGFARPENRLAFYSVMEGFLSECLGGRAESFGSAFEGSTIQVLDGAAYVDGLEAALAAFETEQAASEETGE
ncbi:S9 family peptidase [Henriciella pelagia]|jgi:dipeptidyl aminopeptidase/acylaminoacyl peptidase|uniref:Peptidase S9 n=1 Tax=Henriciella pelagia TaxID=1977912 RepID=A0ABQ1JK27_9PROT|nr:S9 family peptidase [Henriciella pelagia]GGB70272.1 peptidase S9 [Henriciella pelagia]